MVRLGSLADIVQRPRQVRFTPNNGRWAAVSRDLSNTRQTLSVAMFAALASAYAARDLA